MNKKFISLILFLFLLLSGCEDEVTPPPTIIAIEYGSLSGIVIDSETAEPISGARVEALLNQVVDTTDTLGGYFLDSLFVGNDNINIFAEYYENQTIEVSISPDSQTATVSLNPILENLYLYVGAWGGKSIYIVDVDSKSIVDSLYFSEGTISRFTITPGGTKLYITDWNRENIYYLDTKTRIFHSTNIPSGAVFFSPYDNGMFLFTGAGIFTVDTLTDAAVQIDTITLTWSVVFSPTSPIFYFRTQYSAPIYIYDYQQKAIIDSLMVPAFRMKVTPDGREIYFVSPNSSIGVVDLNNKAVTSIGAVNSRGSLAVTPDGQYVLVTDPGGYALFEPIPSGLITVVSTSGHLVEGYIDVNPVAEYNKITDQIVFTPNGRYAFVNDWLSKVFIIDVKNRKALKTIKFHQDNGQIVPMAIGPKN